MKHLISVVETYRVDTEAEAAALIEEEKSSSIWNLNKYNVVAKEAKAKGEVVDAWFRVTLNKVIDSEKEPEGDTRITYEVE